MDQHVDDPPLHRLVRLREQEDRQEHEQHAKPVIGAGLGGNRVSHPRGNALLGNLAGHDGIGQHGIRGRQGSSDRQRQEQRHAQNRHGHGTAGKPHQRHAEAENRGQLAPVAALVGRRQAKGGAHHRDRQRDLRQFLQKRRLGVAGGFGDRQARHGGADENADQQGDQRLGDPEPVLDIAVGDAKDEDGRSRDRQAEIRIPHRLIPVCVPPRPDFPLNRCAPRRQKTGAGSWSGQLL